jgi:hypothetical protein
VNPSEERLRKALTRNDVGSTGSHQAGIHVPKSFTAFFPVLDQTMLNPDRWLSVQVGAATHRWRFIHYNNAVVGHGTRDEYRLTHVHSALQSLRAHAGDILELTRIDVSSLSARLVSQATDGESVLVLQTAGRWRLVESRRRT